MYSILYILDLSLFVADLFRIFKAFLFGCYHPFYRKLTTAKNWSKKGLTYF